MVRSLRERKSRSGSKLPAYPLEIVHWRDHVNKLADSLAAFGQRVRQAIDQSDELGG